KTEAMAHEAARQTLTTGETGSMRGEARAAVDAVVRHAAAPVEADRSDRSSAPAEPPAEARADVPPAVGDRVSVGALGLAGIVTAVHDGSAEIDVRGKRMRAAVRELKVVSIGAGSHGAPGRVSVHVDLQPRENATTDLNVIGCTVDEALARAERF